MLLEQSPRAIKKQLGVSLAEADRYVKSFRKMFAGVMQCQQEVINECRNLGYVSTLCNRRRYIKEINSTNLKERSQAERQALNTLCQVT